MLGRTHVVGWVAVGEPAAPGVDGGVVAYKKQAQAVDRVVCTHSVGLKAGLAGA